MTLKKQSSIRIVGIGDAARKLGCSREHLRLVITGRRTSRRLVAKARAELDRETGKEERDA